MPRNEHFLPQNNGNHSESIPRNFFGTIFRSQPYLNLTHEAGQASAYLYSEARLYKGTRLAPLSQSTATRSTGNISVGVKKVVHCNTCGTVSSLFFPAQISAALSLHFQHLMKTKG